MAHEKRRFPEHVSYITSPGYGTGRDWRQRVGLPRGGPAAVITTLGVLGFAPDTHELELRTWHPFASSTLVRANTGWDLQVGGDAHETPPPTVEELRIIRACDPQGFWTR
jgi:glutaconate CoA-transferase subunit B